MLIYNTKRRAFTLVELSIVLVIIGLIIGGVLTGQQIIQNARITNALNGIQAYQAQFQTYVQNYGVLPGDDPAASKRFPNTTVAGDGDGKGSINGSFDSQTTGDESLYVWSHLRAAGLVKNQLTNTANTFQPPNPFNGIYGFQNGAFSSAFTSTVLCMNHIPVEIAEALDSRLDDGSSASGNMQAMAETGKIGEALTGTVDKAYGNNGASTYTICIKM